MEAINSHVNHPRPNGQLKSVEEEIQKLLANPEIAHFISEHQISQRALEHSYSKLFEFQSEKAKFLAGESKNYEPVLLENQGFIDVAYRPTDLLIKKQELLRKQRRIKFYGIPEGLKGISWNEVDVDLNDPKRQELFLKLNDYLAEPAPDKGLYVYGDMGIGKTHMLAALTNVLAEDGKTVSLVHYPSFCLDINFENVRDLVNEVKEVDVLVLDDIGGESNNAWLRDSVLQVILQYRMQENLLTFFTSNLSMKDLEIHLAETKKTDDLWASKRVMERIKYLSKEIQLQGENRRHG